MEWVELPKGGRAAAIGNPDASTGIVLLPEIFGLHAGVLDYAERLASEHRVLVIDLWAGQQLPALDTPAAISFAVASIDDGRIMRDVAAAKLILGNVRSAVVGFCLGGLYARMASAVVPGFSAAVEFYGRIIYPTLSEQKPIQPLDLLFGRTCPLQCHFGSADPIAPLSHIDELEARLASQLSPARVFRYSGCGHGFMNAHRPNWNAEAAQLAWSRTERFLDDALLTNV